MGAHTSAARGPADLAELFETGTAGALGDAELLARLDSDPGGRAFEVLLRRHGGLVWSVCRRSGCDHHQAEDAFQATFLVLRLRSRSIRRPDSLASWLHGVASRIARRARDQGRRHTTLPDSLAAAEATHPAERVETLAAFDEELARLPDRYRLPLVLCALEGRTHESAARELGWPTGTVAGRLSRGRALLKSRLERRGVSPLLLVPAALESAAVPEALVASTARAVAAASLGKAALGSGAAAALAGQLARSMMRVQLARVVGVAAVLTLFTTGAALVASQTADDPPKPSTPPPAAAAPAAQAVDLHGDPLPPGVLARLGTIRFRHKEEVSALASSVAGEILASASRDGVRVWKTADGSQLHHFDLVGARALALSPDSRLLAAATGSENDDQEQHPFQGSLRVWDLAAKKLLASRDDLPNGALALSFSPDGRTLALAGGDTKTHLLDPSTAADRSVLTGHTRRVTCLGFSPDGKTLATGSRDATARLWDLSTGQTTRTIESPADTLGGVVSVAFDPDPSSPRLLVATSFLLRLLDLQNGLDVLKVDCSEQFGQGCFDAAFMPDGKTLAVSFYDNVRFIVTSNGSVTGTVPSGGFNNRLVVLGVTRIATAGGNLNGAIEIINASGRDRPAEAHCGEVQVVAFSPIGDRIATAARNDPVIRQWSPSDAPLPHLYLKGQSGWVEGIERRDIRSLAWNDDATALAATADDGMLYLYDTSSANLDRIISTGAGWTGAVAFDNDGRTLLALTHDREHRLHIRRFGRFDSVELAKLPVTCDAPLPPAQPNSYTTPNLSGARFSADRKTLVFQHDHTVYFIDAATGRQARKIELPLADSVGSLALSADGKALVTGGWGKTLRVWDADTGHLRREFPALGDDQQINAVALSTDGRYAAAGAGWLDPAAAIFVFDLETGSVRRLSGHGAYTACLAFSPDGKTLASGLRDTTVLLWDVSPRS